METSSFIKSARPSAAAKKQIADAQAKVASLLELVTATEPDRSGRTSQLHREADAVELEFLANPTRANAEKFHAALVRCQQSEISFPRIDGCVHQLLPAAAAVAGPAALEILQTAIDALDAEAAAARDGIKRESVFLDIGVIDRQHAAARAELADNRSAIQQDPLGWLRAYGHA